jgi:hypothetical protein
MSKCRQIISFLILCCIVFTAKAQDQKAVFLAKKVNLTVTNQPLDRVLDQLSEVAGLNFSYDPTLLDTEQRVTASYNLQSVYTILNDLLGLEFDFQELGNQIVIRLRDKPVAPCPAAPDYQTISGQIRDQEYGDPVPYASISVLNKAFGTITNKEGWFELKIPPIYRNEALVVSSMGYEKQLLNTDSLAPNPLLLLLKPVNIRLREIKVRAIKPQWVMEQMLNHIPDNYPTENHLMTAFYREVLMQDNGYINVSEAVIQLLKASYTQPLREDKIRFLKGRKSREVETFQWVDFKMQGGPYYTVQLDVVKTMDSFLDREYRESYRYEAGSMIDYQGRPTYIIHFTPVGKNDFLTYEGKLFIDQESFALVHAQFSLSRNGIRIARNQLIRKKPKGFNVRALDLDYQVSYRKNEGLWYLNTAQSSVSFRVRSRHDQVNSVFHSVSDLLVTKHEPTRLRRFPKEGQINGSDIFTDIIKDYDPEFWGNYNIIQPTDDLRKALKSLGNKLKTE